jgi:acetyl esterase
MEQTAMGTVHPYYRAILEAYAAAKRPFYHQLTPVEARELLRTSLAAAPPQVGLPELAALGDETVPGPAGPVRVRRYRPKGRVSGTCVYMHAGGWVIGDLETGDALCRRIAAGAHCEVVNVDYRLAPENSYPVPLDDAFAVLNWTAIRRAGPIVVAGESAGANLAAACAIRARDAGSPALAGQFLAYPATDHDLTTGSYREVGDLNWLLSTADMRWFWDHYCPPRVRRDNPLVSPLRLDDPTGLAPALIYVAELDPLRDEGLAYAARLTAAGIPVQTRRDAGMLHGYLSLAGALPLAAEAVREAAEWIKQRIHGARI